MAATVTAKVVRLGNSQGIRIPKTIMEQLGFVDEVELVIEGDRLFVQKREHPRAGWAEHFARMAEQGDDELILGDSSTSTFDEEEWEW